MELTILSNPIHSIMHSVEQQESRELETLKLKVCKFKMVMIFY